MTFACPGHVLVAKLAGENVSTAVALDFAGDCGIYNVGTLESARGRGLATGLMAIHLYDARARRCRTASLQSTEIAAPLGCSPGSPPGDRRAGWRGCPVFTARAPPVTLGRIGRSGQREYGSCAAAWSRRTGLLAARCAGWLPGPRAEPDRGRRAKAVVPEMHTLRKGSRATADDSASSTRHR